MKIYLDDVRTPYDKSWTVVRSYHDFIHIINSSFDKIDCISFDHDLGDTFSGFDCAQFLIKYCMDKQKIPPQTYSHSSNPVGRENIIELFNNYLVFIEQVPNSKWVHIEHFANDKK